MIRNWLRGLSNEADTDLVPVAEVWSEPLAQSWAEFLRSSGVPAMVKAGGPGFSFGGPPPFGAQCFVYVTRADAERAEVLLRPMTGAEDDAGGAEWDHAGDSEEDEDDE